METATWRTQKLSVDAEKILSWRNISMKTGLKTEEETGNAEGYKTKKNESAAELSIDLPMSSVHGVNVAQEIETWIALSRDGGSGRFYVGTKDFLGVVMMLESCEVKNLELVGNGIAKSAELSLKFVQATSRTPVKPTGGGGGGSGNGRGPGGGKGAGQSKKGNVKGSGGGPGSVRTKTQKTAALVSAAKKASVVSVVKPKTNIKNLFK